MVKEEFILTHSLVVHALSPSSEKRKATYVSEHQTRLHLSKEVFLDTQVTRCEVGNRSSSADWSSASPPQIF